MIPILKRVLAWAGTCAAGLLLYFFALPLVLQTGWAVSMKLRQKAPECSWANTLRFHLGMKQFTDYYGRAKASVRVVASESNWIGKSAAVQNRRSFWMRPTGFPLAESLGYIIAEQDWTANFDPGDSVHPGDVVLDCGAHVGVFTSKALELGASKVISIEPDPTNIECLRRNFAPEIREGRVVIVPKAVWSKEGTMTMMLGVNGDTGRNSLVTHQDGGSIQVPLTTLDKIVEELSVDKVNFIKMDIERSEHEALRGVGNLLDKRG